MTQPLSQCTAVHNQQRVLQFPKFSVYVLQALCLHLLSECCRHMKGYTGINTSCILLCQCSLKKKTLNCFLCGVLHIYFFLNDSIVHSVFIVFVISERTVRKQWCNHTLTRLEYWTNRCSCLTSDMLKTQLCQHVHRYLV